MFAQQMQLMLQNAQMSSFVSCGRLFANCQCMWGFWLLYDSFLMLGAAAHQLQVYWQSTYAYIGIALQGLWKVKYYKIYGNACVLIASSELFI